MDKNLLDTREELDEILDNVLDGITVQNLDGELIYVNDVAAKMMGFPSGSKLLKTPAKEIIKRYQMMDEEGAPFSLKNLPGRQVLMGEKQAEEIICFKVVGKGSEERWSRVRAKGVYDKDNKLKYVINVISDITEIKEAEKERVDSEQRYKDLVEMAPDVIYAVSNEGVIIDLNPAFERITGWKMSEFLGQSFTTLIHPDDVETAIKMFKMNVSGESTPPYELRIRSKEGEYLVGEFRSMSRYVNGQIVGKFGIARNITGRKKMEETLRFQNLLLEAQSEASIDGILIVDKEGRVLSFNWRFIEMWNIPEKTITNILDKNIFEVIEGKLEESKQFSNLTKYLKSHVDKESRQEVRLKDERIFDTFSSPLKGSNKNFYGRVWFFRDVTDLKEQEKRKDEFIGIASHELRTPLTTIKGYAQILQARLQKFDEKQNLELVIKMQDQLERMSKLIKDLLNVSKIQSGKFEIEKKTFDINKLVLETAEDFKSLGKHNILVKGEVMGNVFGDPNRIYEVLSNLISNAIKYSPTADKVVIKLKDGNKKVTISVQDFGIGISEENKIKIFDRFFRANGVKSNTYPGFGLGLYIASEIARQHQGKLWVESELNKGSIFHFMLPLRD